MDAMRAAGVVIFFLFQISLKAQDSLRLGLPLGHHSWVYSAVFSPDGKTVLTASFDATAKLWEMSSGKLLQSFNIHQAPVNSAVFSPDGKKVLTASWNYYSALMDVVTGELIQSFEGHTKGVFSAVFSPNGERVLTASHDSTAKLWNAQSGKLIQSFNGHTKEVNSAVFSPNGERVLTASDDSTAKLWDAQSGRQLYSFEGHTKKVNSAVFSPDGEKVLTASGDSTARLWDVKSGKQLRCYNEHTNMVSSAIFSPDGKNIITRSDSIVKIWEVISGKFICSLVGHTDWVYSAEFSPACTDDPNGGKFVVTASSDGTAKIWDASTGKMLHNLEGHTGRVISARYSPDGKQVVTASWDETAKIWETRSGEMLHSLEGHTDWIYAADFSRDGKCLATASGDGIARIWETASFKVQNTLGEEFGSYPFLVKYSPDGKYIFATEGYGDAYIWDVQNGKRLHPFDGHFSEINSVVFSPDGEKVLTASDDKTAKLWNALNGKLLYSFKGHTQEVISAVFSPDSKMILTASNDSTANIWDIQSGMLIHNLKHDDKILFAKFIPGANNIVAGTFNRLLRTWNFKTGLIDSVYMDPRINDLLFSPGGNFMLCQLSNNTVDIIDILRKKISSVMKEENGTLNNVEISPDGKFVVTTTYDGSFTIWEASTGIKLVQQFILDKSKLITLLPNGYYKATKNASALLYYVKGLQTIGFDQLDIKYNRPDKVLTALGEAFGNPDTMLINSYYKAWQKRVKKLGIDTSSFEEGYSVPESDFKNRDAVTYEQTNGKLQLQVMGMDTTYALDRFNVWVNEVPVFGQRGINIRQSHRNQIDTTIMIELSDGDNKIETSVLNVNGIESYRIPMYVRYAPQNPAVEKLYFVGIGIDHYKEPGHDLRYSVKDIRDLAQKLKEKYGDDIRIDTLFDIQVNVMNIKKLKDSLSQSGVNDKVIVSFSGHGLLSEDFDYYLSTHDISFKHPEKGGLPYEDLESLLDSIPARKKLLLIDACHSGEVDKEELMAIQQTEKDKESEGLKGGETIVVYKPVLGMKNSFELMQELFANVSRGTGATVISAAAGTQFAQERGDLKNGVFTYSILEQMKPGKELKVSELKMEVGKRVEELTNGRQKPTSRNETIEHDWRVW